MSWSQDYNVPSYIELLLKLTGKTPEAFQEYLEADLRDRLGISVVKHEPVVIAEDGMYGDLNSYKVTLSDGRVFIPKLVESYQENGNYGRDTYEWVLESETPTVNHVYGDETFDIEDEQEYYGGCGDEGCGCGF